MSPAQVARAVEGWVAVEAAEAAEEEASHASKPSTTEDAPSLRPGMGTARSNRAASSRTIRMAIRVAVRVVPAGSAEADVTVVMQR